MGASILCGDAIAVLRTLPEASVHCAVTSPPYWGLRDYGVDGQIGLEESPDAWVARLVEVFRELRRVLRADGTLWLNCGDAYWHDGACGGGSPLDDRQDGGGGVPRPEARQSARRAARGVRPDGLKPKDLLGLPWMLAFALRADGWWLRSEIIWSKPNCLPESVTDRPTRNHEQVFLLTRSARYYYDADAIRQPDRGAWNPARCFSQNATSRNAEYAAKGIASATRGFGTHHDDTEKRGANRRTVWSISPEPFAGAHFATFPTALVEPRILAGTSARGACVACGAPYARVVEKGAPDDDHKRACGADAAGGYNGTSQKGHDEAGVQDASAVKARILAGMLERRTVGWEPTCRCADPREPVRCVVLDPFAGSGTTCLVAHRLGRNSIGIEINPAYCEMAKQRLHDEAPLFATEP